MAIRKCAACQAEMDPDAIFCNECGLAQPLAVDSAINVHSRESAATYSRICPRCRKKIEGEVRFCPDCAYDFAETRSSEPGEMACPNCKKAYSRDDRYCRHCAYELGSISKKSSAQYCTGCGKSFEPNDRFCRHCSADISKSDHTVAIPVVNAATFSQTSSPFSPAAAAQFVPAQSQKSTSTTLINENSSGPHWISPSAAAFVVICFFLPWVEWSCFGSSVGVSGAQLANRDASFLIFPLAAIVTILVYFIFKAQKHLWKARPYIIASSAVGLFLLFYKVNSVPSANVFGATISASDLGFKPKIGGVGTVIGFIIAMIGCVFMGRTMVGLGGSAPVSGWFEPVNKDVLHSGNWFIHHIASLKANKAAMLCYLSPVLLQVANIFLFPFIIIVLGGLGMFISFLLCLFTFFAGQILFLKKEPHRSNPFVRFNAFQSLFLSCSWLACVIAIIIGVDVLRWSLRGVTDPIFVVLGVFYIVLSIYLAMKANKCEIYKLQYLGDWAKSLSERTHAGSDMRIK